MHYLHDLPAFLAAYAASFVEFIEALTIILAIGMTRGWKASLSGAAAGAAILVVLVVLFGPSLHRVPLPALQVTVGLLLLLFGIRWLRKAVLRSRGFIPLHDEAAAFSKESRAMRAQPAAPGVLDAIGFVSSFKATLLEGLEVAFIVIAVGTGGPESLTAASVGALLAFVTVAALGLLLHKPLTAIPENTLKYGVGLLLSAFGVFWIGEGLGYEWPGGDVALLGLIAAWLAVSRIPLGIPAPEKH